jgi:hypothetical protein
MFNPITDEQFAAAAIDVQFPEYTREELLAHDPGGGFLRKYLLDVYPLIDRSANRPDNNLHYRNSC